MNGPFSQIAYSLDGEENLALFGNTTLTGLANGDHNLTIHAKDNAGNIRVSKAVFFSVDVPEPFQTAPVAAASASILVAAAALLGYFRKCRRS